MKKLRASVLLHRLGKGLRENDGHLSGVSRNAFICGGRAIPSPYIEMASGCIKFRV